MMYYGLQQKLSIDFAVYCTLAPIAWFSCLPLLSWQVHMQSYIAHVSCTNMSVYIELFQKTFRQGLLRERNIYLFETNVCAEDKLSGNVETLSHEYDWLIR